MMPLLELPERFQRAGSRRAYELFQHRGGQHGHDLDDWLKGEAEIDASAAKSK